MIDWSIKSKAPIYSSTPMAQKDVYSVLEKTAITLCAPHELLNKRTELLHKCIHLKEFELQIQSHDKSPP